MVFYVSVRSFPFPTESGIRMLSPKMYLAQSFPGLLFVANRVSISNGAVADGRSLYEIELDASYTLLSSPTSLEVKAVLLEALTMFGVHEKSLASAEALAELHSGLGFHASDDKIVKD